LSRRIFTQGVISENVGRKTLKPEKECEGLRLSNPPPQDILNGTVEFGGLLVCLSDTTVLRLRRIWSKGKIILTGEN
jgi:hypothetical protein